MHTICSGPLLRLLKVGASLSLCALFSIAWHFYKPLQGIKISFKREASKTNRLRDCGTPYSQQLTIFQSIWYLFLLRTLINRSNTSLPRVTSSGTFSIVTNSGNIPSIKKTKMFLVSPNRYEVSFLSASVLRMAGMEHNRPGVYSGQCQIVCRYLSSAYASNPRA